MADLNKKITICVIMLLAIAVFIPVYAAKEPARQEAAVARIKRDEMARGAEFFVTHCAACHGKTGDNIPGKNLSQTQINQTGLAKIISRGIPGTPMPAFGDQEGGSLKKFEIGEIVTFLMNWDQPLVEQAIVHLKPAGGPAVAAPPPAGTKPAASPSPPAATSPPPATATPPVVVVQATPTAPVSTRTPAPAAGTPTVEAPQPTTPAVKPPPATATPRPPSATTAAAPVSPPASGGGDAAKGKTAYAARCAMCHGPDGAGGFAPALKGRNAASMKDVVRKGRGGMPAMNTTMLSDADLDNIGAFLSSLK